MDPVEAVKDSDVGNEQILSDTSEQTFRTNLEDRLSYPEDSSTKDFSASFTPESQTDFIGSILKETYSQDYMNTGSTCRVEDIPLPPLDIPLPPSHIPLPSLSDIPLPPSDPNTLDKGTEVLQSGLVDYDSDSQTSNDAKMDVDEDDNDKTEEGAIIVSEDSINDVKADCLPVEMDVSNINMEALESESHVAQKPEQSEQLHTEMMETDENLVTDVQEDVRKSYSGWEFNTDKTERVFDRTISEVINSGTDASLLVSGSDMRVDDLDEMPIDMDKSEVELVKIEKEVDTQFEKEETGNVSLETHFNVAETLNVQAEKDIINQITDASKEIEQFDDTAEEQSDNTNISREREELKVLADSTKEVEELHDIAQKSEEREEIEDIVHASEEAEELQDLRMLNERGQLQDIVHASEEEPEGITDMSKEEEEEIKDASYRLEEGKELKDIEHTSEEELKDIADTSKDEEIKDNAETQKKEELKSTADALEVGKLHDVIYTSEESSDSQDITHSSEKDEMKDTGDTSEEDETLKDIARTSKEEELKNIADNSEEAKITFITDNSEEAELKDVSDKSEEAEIKVITHDLEEAELKDVSDNSEETEIKVIMANLDEAELRDISDNSKEVDKLKDTVHITEECEELKRFGHTSKEDEFKDFSDKSQEADELKDIVDKSEETDELKNIADKLEEAKELKDITDKSEEPDQLKDIDHSEKADESEAIDKSKEIIHMSEGEKSIDTSKAEELKVTTHISDEGEPADIPDALEGDKLQEIGHTSEELKCVVDTLTKQTELEDTESMLGEEAFADIANTSKVDVISDTPKQVEDLKDILDISKDTVEKDIEYISTETEELKDIIDTSKQLEEEVFKNIENEIAVIPDDLRIIPEKLKKTCEDVVVIHDDIEDIEAKLKIIHGDVDEEEINENVVKIYDRAEQTETQIATKEMGAEEKESQVENTALDIRETGELFELEKAQSKSDEIKDQLEIISKEIVPASKETLVEETSVVLEDMQMEVTKSIENPIVDTVSTDQVQEVDMMETEMIVDETESEAMETESDVEATSVSTETQDAVIEIENRTEIESKSIEANVTEGTSNDIPSKGNDLISEIENAREVVEVESTYLETESTTTSEQLEEVKSPEKSKDYEDQTVEQPSSTNETKVDEQNQELIHVTNVPNEGGGDNSVVNADLENNFTSLKDADKSSDVLEPGDGIERTLEQTTVNTGESNSEPSETDNTDVENAMVTSNNIDQSIDEDEADSNPVFVHVDTENEKGSSDKNNETIVLNNQDEEMQVSQPQEDPIASDDFTPAPAEGDDDELDQSADDQSNYEQIDEEQGASEEMCIIPDTERVISQAEKDAAAGMVPLCDPTELEAFSSDPSSDGASGETSVEKRKMSNQENFLVSLCADEKVYACIQCCLPRKSKYSVLHNKKTSYVCDEGCLNNLKRRHGDKVVMSTEGDLRVKKLASGVNNDNIITKVKFRRKCSECQNKLTLHESPLSWETMEFCNESCLSKYQKKVASNCSSCQVVVRNNCLGKYCVRFGYDIRQFCSSVCLEEYKKGLKVCSYCQKDMSSGGGDGFLAPVGDKGQFKDFCTQLCMEKYDVMSNNRSQVHKPGTLCSVCRNEKPITIEFEHKGKINLFCGEPCFVAFKFVNNIAPAKCNMCKKYFDNKVLEEHSMFYDNALHSFCSKSCQNIYIIGHRKIVPCSWCKVKKYNFDMIKRSATTGSALLMCSLNCLNLYQVSINAVQSKKTKCDHCKKTLQPLYHLTMSDATMRNFCSYPCVMAFQNQFPKTPITLNEPEESSVPVPTGGPKRSKRLMSTKQTEPAPAEVPTIPVISSVQSLAITNGPTTATRGRPKTSSDSSVSTSPPLVKTQIKQHFIIKPTPLPPQRNIGTLCKVNMQTKGVNFKPTTCNKEVQTDEIQEKTALIPIPVPIYVPAPMWMYSMPFPVPFPFPLPVPVPIFIPTTRNSANGIMKEIKKIQVKIPTDPFEAELLMMAEMVAGDKKEEHTDSESEEEDTAPPPDEATFSPEPVDASNTFGDDMLQMALKMATELDEPAVDLEGALTANTITATQGTEPPAVEEPPEEPQPIHNIMERQSIRGRKRPGRPPKTGGTVSKRGRRSSSQMEIPIMAPPQPPPPPEPVEKPDANMCLKYTFGVNAWKQWVTTKNAELEKTSRRVKLFKPEILQLTADELNYSLCLFVKEVRKPNGQEYAPDTIYYLCLGIQQYLFENSRIDNIFCDSYYEKFTDCLDEVAKKFSILYNDSHYIVTRVEEEHLWESKQLGAHSPHVLLSTLMFFNTKHFNLTTVDEHMQLSFSHIMKHWKRNSHNQPGTAKMAGSRNVLLRFYPPQTSSADASQRKKKVYEQQENEENPLRCPVKLYEFYLSKCPESVKTRNDVFYLLPERSCVPDSPVWYSTMPLPRAALEKMLHRVKMVKEINVALLTS